MGFGGARILGLYGGFRKLLDKRSKVGISPLMSGVCGMEAGREPSKPWARLSAGAVAGLGQEGAQGKHPVRSGCLSPLSPPSYLQPHPRQQFLPTL